MKGFISLHRKLMDNPIWSDPNYLKLWIYCLFQATHKERQQLVGNQIVSLERGQFVTGRFALAEDLNKGVKPKQRLDKLTWWRYLNNLQTYEMLNIKSTNKYSVVTIVNYDTYQNVFNQSEHESEQQLNINRTSNEQQLNTNNNVNNLNNVNNNITTTTAVGGFGKLHQIFEQNICKLSPIQTESFEAWYNDFKQNDEIILEAIKIAADRDRKNWGFVESSLFREWMSKNLTTIDQVRSYERNKFNRGNQQRSYYQKPQRQEVVPDWFKDRKNKSPVPVQMSPEELEKTKKEMEDVLSRYQVGGS